MQGILTLGVLSLIGYLIYKSGKRVGSRKGFYAGLSGRRSHRR